MRRAEQRRAGRANFIDVVAIIGRITHRHDNVDRIAKLLMNRAQRGDMLVAAVAGIPHQDSQRLAARRAFSK